MKILFLANRVPYPPYRGDKLKIYNLAKNLCKEHELHLITFAQTKEEELYIEPLKKVFKKVSLVPLPKYQSVFNCITQVFSKQPFQVAYFENKALQKVLAEQVQAEQFDAIHVQHLRMAPYALPYKHLKLILDLPDAFSLYWKRKQDNTKNPILKIFEAWEQKKVYQFEKTFKAFKKVLVCSKEDKQYLEKEHHLNNIDLLPNGVDTTTFYPRNHDYTTDHILLFTGNMDYKPNIDAVQYFVQEIFPTILKQKPETKFIIAGQRPVAKVLALASPNIEVTGFVEDIAQMYNAASVVVAPLRFGAGTQNKVLEALAMGVPVVCSHIGFEGLGIESGNGVIKETQTDAFAKAVLELLSSETQRKAVGEKGIALIQNNFSWEIISKKLIQYFNTIA